jgi:hypothetical protein
LRETGYIEGQNIVIAFRWAEGNSNRLPTLAKELGGTPAAQAAKAAAAILPIVFVIGDDPVKVGLTASFNLAERITRIPALLYVLTHTLSCLARRRDSLPVPRRSCLLKASRRSLIPR